MASGSALDARTIRGLKWIGVKISVAQRAANGRLYLHVVDLLMFFKSGKHRPIERKSTPRPLLRAIKLFCVIPALLLPSHGRRVSPRNPFNAVKGDISVLFPWLMGFLPTRQQLAGGVSLRAGWKQTA